MTGARKGAPGPLVVSARNARYFAATDGGAEAAILLTGSHVWNNLHDGLGPGADRCGEERNSFPAYLDFLADHGHNFIRLWRWEHFMSAVPGFHLCMTPQPWQRTGAGAATDGRPKFDLTRFEPAYFGRLRERVIAAGARGIYVSVMLFEGFCFQHCLKPANLEGHPFHAANNVNGVAIESVRDYQVLPLPGRARTLQRAYIRKVIETVSDLPNVLYEVANESSGDPAGECGDSTAWQYWVIAQVKAIEAELGLGSHPIGMTFQYPDASANASLFDGPADWVSPGFTRAVADDPWFLDPPANDGTKLVVSDTDHYAAGRADPLWAWKTFLRGHHPILMDYGIIDVEDPLAEIAGSLPSYDYFEPTRFAMGAVLRCAAQVPLIEMEPRGELCSTGYALAAPGREYLILQPGGEREEVAVALEAGRYTASWSDLSGREHRGVSHVELARPASVTLSSPFGAAPSVLRLARETQPGAVVKRRNPDDPVDGGRA